MTPEDWAKGVLILRSTYTTSFKLDKDGIAVWFDLLKDLPGERVLAAIVHMCRNTKAFPSVAEIRQLAEEKPADQADAWGEFIQAVGRVGYTGTPRWSNPVIGQVVEQMGGWMHVCQTMKVDDEPTWRAQFRRAYEATAERARRDRTFVSLGVPVAPGGLLAAGGDG